jgi:hypothetical protein
MIHFFPDPSSLSSAPLVTGTFIINAAPFSTSDLSMCACLDVSTASKVRSSTSALSTTSASSPSEAGPGVAFEPATHKEANAVLADLLSLVYSVHKMFSRYGELDAVRRSAFVLAMPHLPPPTANENAAIDKASSFDRNKNWRVFPGSIKEAVSCFYALSTADSAWGKGVCTVDAPAEQVLAYLWLNMNYERLEQHVQSEGNR